MDSFPGPPEASSENHTPHTEGDESAVPFPLPFGRQEPFEVVIRVTARAVTCTIDGVATEPGNSIDQEALLAARQKGLRPVFCAETGTAPFAIHGLKFQSGVKK